MSIEKYLDEMRVIQEKLLEFLDNRANSEENFLKLKQVFDDQKIIDDPHKLKSVLNLLTKIANYHYRGSGFFEKIERILLFFKFRIKEFYTNSEIFTIFKKNKRILLFLLENEMIIFDNYIAKKITDKFCHYNYIEYFTPELKPFINEEWFYDFCKEKLLKTIPENFNEMRKIGESEYEVFRLIRNDSLSEFIFSTNKNTMNYIEVKNSIYETNLYLIKKHIKNYFERRFDKKMTLIEYAAFYGSLCIFNYLRSNGFELQPSLWLFAIHGKNMEIIHILEENNIVPDDNTYKECLKESIKFHYNDITNYLLNKYLKDEIEKPHETFIDGIKYYNFSFIKKELIDKSSYYDFFRYGYYNIAKLLQVEKDLNINKIRTLLYQ